MFNQLKERWDHSKSIGKTWWWLFPILYSAFWGIDSSINKWDFGIKDSWNKHTAHLPKHWEGWLIGLLLLMILSLIEGSYRHHQKTRTPSEPPANLQVDWHGLIYGPLYLSDVGIWSDSSATFPGYRYQSVRMKVRNEEIHDRRVGTARGVKAKVEFTHDTGISSGAAAPAAWLNERTAAIDIGVGDHKEIIIAVKSDHEWSAVSNVRLADGTPQNRTAMQFRDAPCLLGSFKVSLIANGQAESREYSWDNTSGMLPVRIRMVTPQ